MDELRPRSGNRRRAAPLRLLGLVPPLLLCLGCPLAPSPSDADPAADIPTLDQAGNSSLSTATALPLGAAGELRFRGAIDGSTDIDIYNLGRLSPGDRIHADAQRISGNLDAVLGLFDSRQYLIAFNDDRAADGSDLNPLLDVVLRGADDTYYLGIIAYPDALTSGWYEVTVHVQRSVGVPAPQAQTVYLNWAGGRNIVIPNVGTFTLPAFSATDVGLPAAQTAALKQRVQQVVAERYADFNLLVLNSDADVEPATPHSTVYFGGQDARAFAISEAIDTFNENPSDATIIFTRSFRAAFSTTPTLEQMSQALGNTVAHEIGHLLGLVHTQDCTDLMDTTCYNDRLLSPQEFKTARLDFTVFPWGYQAAREILSWILGLVSP